MVDASAAARRRGGQSYSGRPKGLEMTKHLPELLRFYAYVSRAKVNQLYEQLSDYSVDKKTVTREKSGDLAVDAGVSALLGVFKGSLKAGGRLGENVEEAGEVTTIQKLARVLEHIDRYERVIDLGAAIDRGPGSLDAFCYTYTGQFAVMGQISRNYGQLRRNAEAVSRTGADAAPSETQLVEIAERENEFNETGPNQGSLVSDMCIIASRRGSYTIELACSYKYFTDMGGSWSSDTKEWYVWPHSGNMHFFSGAIDEWFDCMLFINGIKGRSILGSPLLLAHSRDPGLAIS
jgi:hypothetical protein